MKKEKEKYVPSLILDASKIIAPKAYAERVGLAPSNIAVKMDNIEKLQKEGFKGEFEVIRYNGGRFVYLK